MCIRDSQIDARTVCTGGNEQLICGAEASKCENQLIAVRLKHTVYALSLIHISISTKMSSAFEGMSKKTNENATIIAVSYTHLFQTS